jgi:hypothetical protein
MDNHRHPAFFGYGSLVNRATHGYAPATPARITGWRRVWRHTRLRPFAFLSAEPADARIDGLVAAVPGDDWAALDEREGAYRRHPLDPTALDHDANWAISVAVYAVDADHADPTARHPILRSYLDVVLQGYLREFGTAGADTFMATTAGWDCGLHDDRAAPLYSRAQPLGPAERAEIDALTAHLPRHGRKA